MGITKTRTLSGVFGTFAARHPDKTFLIFEDLEGRCRTWTFVEFDRQVNQTAWWLLDMGIEPGQAFTQVGMNSPAFVSLAIAASRIGAIMVPGDFRATVDELAYILDHSDSRLLIAEPDQLEVARRAAGGTQVQEVVLDCGPAAQGHVVMEDRVERQRTSRPGVATDADDVVHMLYTSGTTSKPKGVMLTNRALLYGAEVFARASGLGNDDRHLITLPFYHAAAQCHAFWPSLVAGASMVVSPRFSPSRFFPLAVRHQATMAALFSAPLRMLLSQPDDPSWRSHRLRNVTFAVALSQQQFDEWDRRVGARLQHLWGMTETVGLPLMSPLYGPRRLLSMGCPVLGYEVKVAGDGGEQLAPGEVGQILVKADPGRTVMKGYFKNPQATAETIRDGWLYTGDNAYCDEEGFFYFVDRNKDLIKRGGENIAPSEIENVIKEIPAVQDVAVVGVPDDMYDEVPQAYVVVQDDCQLTAESILEHCRNKLSKYKIPVAVLFCAEFPRTSVGKIQKHLLSNEEEKRRASSQ